MIYTYNILKQVNPNTGVSTKALNIVPNIGQPPQIANKAYIFTNAWSDLKSGGSGVVNLLNVSFDLNSCAIFTVRGSCLSTIFGTWKHSTT